MAVTHVTIHTTQGSYTSAINWFKNCAAGVSAHYVIRSSDGQITQMVREADKAWHVGTSNGYTVGIEHEGYVSDPGTWYTDAMYNASALLSRDILNSRGLARKVFNGLPYWNSKPADSRVQCEGSRELRQSVAYRSRLGLELAQISRPGESAEHRLGNDC
ncbi:MAG: N-acetylmuramoyl-L-alanine amidase [Pyrinomonadaceae bacterium]